MDIPGVQRWYASYLDDFIALCRGEHDDVTRMLDHYDVPLLLATDDGARTLDEAQVLTFLREQVVALRADGYDRSDLVDSDTVVLNRGCATHRARVVRVRTDGTEITRLQATYLVTHGPRGHRIAAIVGHAAP